MSTRPRLTTSKRSERRSAPSPCVQYQPQPPAASNFFYHAQKASVFTGASPILYLYIKTPTPQSSYVTGGSTVFVLNFHWLVNLYFLQNVLSSLRCQNPSPANFLLHSSLAHFFSPAIFRLEFFVLLTTSEWCGNLPGWILLARTWLFHGHANEFAHVSKEFVPVSTSDSPFLSGYIIQRRPGFVKWFLCTFLKKLLQESGRAVPRRRRPFPRSQDQAQNQSINDAG